ncbi:hypothetical protein [Arthrobacter rhombi]|uniref:hypothetical protein n=1 Tax=Arthrobacter rhombi TaxID=71253 RepID=UPI003FD1FA0C
MKATLSAIEAAERAGMSPTYFRQVMSRLNNTSRDLRAPAAPGERARRYDPARLDQWVAAGRPAEADEADGDARSGQTVRARASRTLTGGWDVVAEGLDALVVARTLDQARNAVRQRSALALGIAPEEITIELEIILNELAAETVREYEEIRAEVKALEERSAALRSQSVRQLREQGFTMAEIARVLGVSMQRVQQIDVANRDPETPSGTSHPRQAER